MFMCACVCMCMCMCVCMCVCTCVCVCMFVCCFPYLFITKCFVMIVYCRVVCFTYVLLERWTKISSFWNIYENLVQNWLVPQTSPISIIHNWLNKDWQLRNVFDVDLMWQIRNKQKSIKVTIFFWKIFRFNFFFFSFTYLFCFFYAL